jgi:hypothetical protein
MHDRVASAPSEQHLPFAWIFATFCAFVEACGFTHVMDIVVLWPLLYWVSGGLKFITAIASLVTAIALPVLVRRVGQVLKQAASSRENELRFLGVAESSLD